MTVLLILAALVAAAVLAWLTSLALHNSGVLGQGSQSLDRAVLVMVITSGPYAWALIEWWAA